MGSRVFGIWGKWISKSVYMYVYLYVFLDFRLLRACYRVSSSHFVLNTVWDLKFTGTWYETRRDKMRWDETADQTRKRKYMIPKPLLQTHIFDESVNRTTKLALMFLDIKLCLQMEWLSEKEREREIEKEKEVKVELQAEFQRTKDLELGRMGCLGEFCIRIDGDR